jgi:hypothetical protein
MIGNDAIVFDGVAHVFNFEKWTVDDINEMVYDNSSTDMLCAMPLPPTGRCSGGRSTRWRVAVPST